MSSFFRATRACVPLALSYIPIGCSFAVMAMQAGLSAPMTLFMSFAVMSGAAQIMAIGMITQGTPFPIILLISAFMSMRNLILSSSVLHRLGKLSLWQKIVGPYAMGDAAFAVFSMDEDPDFPFLMGCTFMFGSVWVASTALGCAINTVLPPIVADSCAIAYYAAFISMLFPPVRKSLKVFYLVLLTAAVNALLHQFLPSGWAIMISMVGCAAAGTYFIPPDEKEAQA